jgi:hypothetical protein
MLKINVTLSSGQETPVGKVLYHFFYSNRALCEMAPNLSGYPHNGGEHTLRISGEPGECSAFIELMIEAYPRIIAQLQYVLDEISNGNRRIDINKDDSAVNAAA